MIAMVLVGASQFPLPELPPLAFVGEHVTDPGAEARRASS